MESLVLNHVNLHALGFESMPPISLMTFELRAFSPCHIRKQPFSRSCRTCVALMVKARFSRPAASFFSYALTDPAKALCPRSCARAA